LYTAATESVGELVGTAVVGLLVGVRDGANVGFIVMMVGAFVGVQLNVPFMQIHFAFPPCLESTRTVFDPSLEPQPPQ
jgi:hypothetical protein